jgi:hypothetical protein
MTGAVAGCARAQARAPQTVAMVIPAPPPRVPIPVSLPDPEPLIVPEPEPPPPEAPAKPRPEAPSQRTERPPSAAPPPAPAPGAPPPVLQTTANVGALEQRASSLLVQAERNLGRVNYRDLGAQARAQYDRAMSFIKNARSALSNRNVSFAEQLAVKAAAVARELVKS